MLPADEEEEALIAANPAARLIRRNFIIEHVPVPTPAPTPAPKPVSTLDEAWILAVKKVPLPIRPKPLPSLPASPLPYLHPLTDHFASEERNEMGSR